MPSVAVGVAAGLGFWLSRNMILLTRDQIHQKVKILQRFTISNSIRLQIDTGVAIVLIVAAFAVTGVSVPLSCLTKY
jgi:H+/Cl- antiporter ClcA